MPQSKTAPAITSLQFECREPLTELILSKARWCWALDVLHPQLLHGFRYGSANLGVVHNGKSELCKPISVSRSRSTGFVCLLTMVRPSVSAALSIKSESPFRFWAPMSSSKIASNTTIDKVAIGGPCAANEGSSGLAALFSMSSSRFVSAPYCSSEPSSSVSSP